MKQSENKPLHLNASYWVERCKAACRRGGGDFSSEMEAQIVQVCKRPSQLYFRWKVVLLALILCGFLAALWLAPSEIPRDYEFFLGTLTLFGLITVAGMLAMRRAHDGHVRDSERNLQRLCDGDLRDLDG